MSNNHVLVTGGAGYIGSHVCKALSQAGYLPVVLDNLCEGHRWAVQWGPLEVGDIADRALVEGVLDTYRPQTVLHFAAFASVGESVENPGKYYQNNVAGTLNLLLAMREAGVKRMIFSSTCAVYGVPWHLPLREDHPLDPISPYGRSKQIVEGMLSDFAIAHGLRFVSLRYFNAAGADLAGEIGESHHPEGHLIPLTLQVASGKRAHITLFGRDYDTPDGTCIRDYIHVSDLAQAHLLAMKRLERGDSGGFFNLGNNRGHSILEVLDMVRRVTGHPLPSLDGPRRPGDPPVLVGAYDRAARELGWQPANSSLATIVESAWQWEQSQAG